MTIYIDIIFLENLFMNFIILFATGIILKSQKQILRVFLSSTIGAIYAILMYIYELEVYSNIFLKIMLSITMVEIAFNPKNIKSFMKFLTIFYLTSFTFGGVAFAFIYFISPKNILFNNGKLIGIYPIKTILFGGIVGFIIITISFRSIKKKFTKEDIICSIKIIINNMEKNINCIIDTGNFLKEPISKAPVVVVNRDSLRELIPNTILNNVKEIINGEDIQIGEFSERIRIIPFTSLGKANGLLLGIKADSAKIYYQDNEISIENAIIGIYLGVLNKQNKYEALIGLEALEG